MQNISSSAAFADSKPHYELLDGLRGIAALLVIWYHIFEGFATSPIDQRFNHGYLAVDFFFILQHGALALRHEGDDLHERLGVGGEHHFIFPLALVRFMGDKAFLHTDPFAVAFAQNGLGVHVDELILQRTGTTVDDKNFHNSFLPKKRLAFLIYQIII